MKKLRRTLSANDVVGIIGALLGSSALVYLMYRYLAYAMSHSALYYFYMH